MKNRFKKLAIICIAFVGISLVATAAVNLFEVPQAEIVSATNNSEGYVYFVFRCMYTSKLELIDCTDSRYALVWEDYVGYSSEEKFCAITITDLSPGLYTFKLLARNVLTEEMNVSDPFYVYVNTVEP